MKFQVNTILTAIFISIALVLSACGGKSDADLQKSASDAVKKDTKASAVTVAVKDGVATLTGTVEDQTASKAAESAAKVEGVKSVTNNIMIKPPATPMATPMSTTNSNMAKPMGANANMTKPMSDGNMAKPANANMAKPK